MGNPETDTSIRELVVYMKEMYTELTGKPADNEIIEISGEEFYGKGYEDMDRVPPDISKLQALGWNPTRDKRATFEDAMRYNLDPAVHASILG